MISFSKFAELERNGWSDDSIVQAYVNLFGPVTGVAASNIAEKMGRAGHQILDLCCGQGDLTKMLVQAGSDVSGLDFSPEMIALAQEAAPLANIKLGDAQALPFEDDSFDAVVCNFGMMHLPDQPRALTEICRVLKSGGEFMMATWVGPEASPAFGTVFGAIKSHADFSQAPQQPDLFAFARPDSAEEMISRAGLELMLHEILNPAWILSKPDELFEIFMTGTVGARMLITSQEESVVTAIREQIATNVAENFAVADGYRVPAPVAVISARKL